MPLGNPIRKQNESRMVSVLATEGQTVFTVQGGYIINHISVFRNGVRLSPAEDFTAGDGSTVTLNNAANVEDRIDFHIFDRFTVQNAIIGAASTQTINGDLVLNGKLFGALDVPSINLTGIVTTTNLNVTGVSTFSDDVEFHGVNGISSITFDKSANNLLFKDGAKAAFGDSSDLIVFHDGTLSKIQNSSSGQLEIISNDIDLRSSTGDKNYFTAQVGGAATVFYNNSVRITTSPSGADVTGTLNVTGVSTFAGDVNLGNASSDTVTVSGHVDSDIVPSGSTRDLGGSGTEWRHLYSASGVVASDDIAVHAGDSNTKIRFPAVDTVTVETGGSERVRIASGGAIIKGNSGTQVSVGNGANTQLIGSAGADASLALIRQAAGGGEFYFAAGTSGTNISSGNGLGFIKFMGYHTDGYDEYARIEAFADGTTGNGDAPGRIIFKTTADGANSGTERLRINSDGAVHIQDGSASAARFSIGNSGDLKIFHTNPGSYIQDGSSALSISSARIDLNSAGGESMARFYQDAQVELYHNNIKRLETLSNGVRAVNQFFVSEGTISLEKAGVHHHRIIANDTGNDLGFQQSSDTGSNTNFTTYLRIKDGGNIALPQDNQSLLIGAGEDLQLYHSGSFNFLVNNNSKNFVIQAKSGENAILTVPDGEVALYHNNNKSCETTSQGLKILDGTGSQAALEVVATGTNRSDVRILSTGSGDAYLWMDASNGDLSGADYAFLRHTNADLDLEIVNYAADVILKVRGGSVGSGGLRTAIHCTENGRVALYYNGNLKAFTTTWGFQVDGDFIAQGDNQHDLGASNERWSVVYAANGSINTSDKNEKNTIVESDLGLDFIKKLKPISYKWNKDDGKTHYGLIAQDVEETLTGIGKTVSDFGGIHKEDDSPMGIGYSELIAPLIKALQEASAKIETLEAKVAALEGS